MATEAAWWVSNRIRPSRMNLILLVFLFFPLPALFHFLSLPRLTSCLPPPSGTHCCSWSSPWESDCSATSPKQNMYRVTGTAHLLRNQTQKMLAGTKDHRRPEAHFTPRNEQESRDTERKCVNRWIMLCQFETARGRKKKGMLEKVYVCVLVKQECLLLVPQNKLGRDVKKKLGDQHSVQKKFNHLCR